MSVSTFEEITKTKPERALTEPLKKTAGRNNNGRITTRHRGGGHKRLYRIIDWKRNKIGIQGKVIAIEYDPNRSARIALIEYADGERRYILAPVGVRVGMRLSSGPEADLSPGNALALRDIPVGSIIHNIELKPGRGGQLVRGAGVGAQLMAKESDWAQVRLPSGEVRRDPRRVHGHARPGRQSRARHDQHRQSRSHAAHGLPAHGARLGDEPARPSPRRW